VDKVVRLLYLTELSPPIDDWAKGILINYDRVKVYKKHNDRLIDETNDRAFEFIKRYKYKKF